MAMDAPISTAFLVAFAFAFFSTVLMLAHFGTICDLELELTGAQLWFATWLFVVVVPFTIGIFLEGREHIDSANLGSHEEDKQSLEQQVIKLQSIVDAGKPLRKQNKNVEQRIEMLTRQNAALLNEKTKLEKQTVSLQRELVRKTERITEYAQMRWQRMKPLGTMFSDPVDKPKGRTGTELDREQLAHNSTKAALQEAKEQIAKLQEAMSGQHLVQDPTIPALNDGPASTSVSTNDLSSDACRRTLEWELKEVSKELADTKTQLEDEKQKHDQTNLNLQALLLAKIQQDKFGCAACHDNELLLKEFSSKVTSPITTIRELVEIGSQEVERFRIAEGIMAQECTNALSELNKLQMKMYPNLTVAANIHQVIEVIGYGLDHAQQVHQEHAILESSLRQELENKQEQLEKAQSEANKLKTQVSKACTKSSNLEAQLEQLRTEKSVLQAEPNRLQVTAPATSTAGKRRYEIEAKDSKDRDVPPDQILDGSNTSLGISEPLEKRGRDYEKNKGGEQMNDSVPSSRLHVDVEQDLEIDTLYDPNWNNIRKEEANQELVDEVLKMARNKSDRLDILRKGLRQTRQRLISSGLGVPTRLPMSSPATRPRPVASNPLLRPVVRGVRGNHFDAAAFRSIIDTPPR